MTSRPSSRSSGRAALLTLGIGIGLLVTCWWQRQAIYDYIQLRGYNPSTVIVGLADSSTMTDSARRVFYVNKPQQEDRSTFASSCPSSTEQSVVLGCYIGGQRGIYLLRVDNQELTGIQQVTAAHEMLHAAYDRLSSNERTRIDGLLQQYYDTGLQDQSIKDTIDAYRKTEPNDIVNEMHSIIGTQASDLPKELEQYYARYFRNRGMLVGYYNGYEQAFTSRQQQIKDYDLQLADTKKSIDELEATTETGQQELQAQRNQLNQQRQSGDTAAYNAGVSDYNRAVNAYNASVRRLQTLVSTYNELVVRRNSIAFEERQLVESLTVPQTL